MHDEMFDWLLACWEKGILRGWDWHFDLMTVAIELAKTERETQRIREALSQMELEEEDSCERQQAQEYMLTLICKTEGEDAGVRFMEERLSNSGFREKLIERAIRQGDFAKAERLAEEGVKQDEKNLPGLADDWRNYLLEIYQRVSNKEQVVRLARYFLMSFSERYHAHRYYYDLLKSLVPSEQWTGYVEGVVAELNEDNRYGRRYAQIAELYVWEEQWVKLLKLLWRYPAFSHIEEAEKYLKADYAEELASLYRDTILTYLENNMGREHYQMACKYIRRMIKLKAQPMAMELVETLKTTYRKRRALLEELERI